MQKGLHANWNRTRAHKGWRKLEVKVHIADVGRCPFRRRVLT